MNAEKGLYKKEKEKKKKKAPFFRVKTRLAGNEQAHNTNKRSEQAHNINKRNEHADT